LSPGSGKVGQFYGASLCFMKKVGNSVSPLLKSFRRVLHMLTNFELLSNQPVSLLSDRDDFFSVTLLVWIFFNQLVLRGLLFKDF